MHVTTNYGLWYIPPRFKTNAPNEYWCVLEISNRILQTMLEIKIKIFGLRFESLPRTEFHAFNQLYSTNITLFRHNNVILW